GPRCADNENAGGVTAEGDGGGDHGGDARGPARRQRRGAADRLDRDPRRSGPRRGLDDPFSVGFRERRDRAPGRSQTAGAGCFLGEPLTRLRGQQLVPPLLRENRDFRLFFSGQAVSLVGDQITMLALPLVGVLTLHASAAQMGYLTTAGLLPNL